MTASGSIRAESDRAWAGVRDRLRARGLRWTPQRRTLIEVLSQSDGHVTGSELVERCREIDPGTIPSTVYRTLDVLEELGLLSHSHGADGREEFHVLPAAIHGHLHCIDCGTTWEIEAGEAASLVAALERRRDFAVDVTHLSIAGRCSDCSAALDP
jgi:Fur family ferric uptake transcriptional regulator